jgi:rhodanese-related sulfurtransferase
MVTEIKRNELQQKLEHPKKSLVLETLPPEQYRQGHIPGALNLSPDQVRTFAFRIGAQKGPRGDCLLCRTQVPRVGKGC